MSNYYIKQCVKSNKTNKNIFYEDKVNVNEYDNYKEQKGKLAKAMYMQDVSIKNQYAIEHQKGYCPHCHMLLPLSGECDCGYVAPKRIIEK